MLKALVYRCFGRGFQHKLRKTAVLSHYFHFIQLKTMLNAWKSHSCGIMPKSRFIVVLLSSLLTSDCMQLLLYVYSVDLFPNCIRKICNIVLIMHKGTGLTECLRKKGEISDIMLWYEN